MPMDRIKIGDRLILNQRDDRHRHYYWRFQVVAILEHEGERRWLCVKLYTWPLDHFQIALLDDQGNGVHGFAGGYEPGWYYAGQRSKSKRNLLAP
ncbi:hypothetical protein LCGC14_1123730 [marine sediment metagenome]|uniref:Uncharacterized protein n=1 Tax=marine sediment metagenome TaxID=412755 RepID=A0A0F9MR28_9ZZZZ